MGLGLDVPIFLGMLGALKFGYTPKMTFFRGKMMILRWILGHPIL
jgi:hypothetical protein